MSIEEKEKENGLSEENKGDIFDFSAFAEPVKTLEVKEEKAPEREKQVETEKSNDGENTNSFSDSDKSDRSDNNFIWGDTIPDRNSNSFNQNETKTENANETIKTEESKEVNKEVDNKEISISEDQFSYVANELNLKAKNINELKESLTDIVNENKRLKENYPKTNEKIGNYKKLLNLEDKDLVTENLKVDGFEGKELENAIERYLDNDILDIEAKKIRNTLNSAIDFEKKELINAEANEIAKQNQEREDGIRELNSYLGSTDQMFGFKMATSDKVDNVRKDHEEYITSGNYLNEITSSSSSLAESAWLWRNRETILKAMRNQGFNSGRADIIKEIGNPDANAGTRTFADPSTGEGFDPGKFGIRNK